MNSSQSAQKSKYTDNFDQAAAKKNMKTKQKLVLKIIPFRKLMSEQNKKSTQLKGIQKNQSSVIKPTES